MGEGSKVILEAAAAHTRVVRPQRVEIDVDPDATRKRRQAKRVVRVLLAVATTVAVLWGGGSALLAVQVVAALLTVATIAAVPALPHKPLRGWSGWLLLSLGLFSALYILPLPSALVGLLHPRAVELAKGGEALLGIPAPALLPLSLSPGDAALQVGVYLCGAVTALLTSIALMGTGGRTTAQRYKELLIGLSVVQGAAMLLSGPGRDLGLVPGVVGAGLRQLVFVNPNHQAALLNVGFALSLGTALQQMGAAQLRSGLVALSLGILSLATGSRGGAVATLLVLVLAYLKRPIISIGKRVDSRTKWINQQKLIASVAVALVMMAVLLLYPLMEQEVALFRGLASEPKLMIVTRLGEILRASPLLGAGPGSTPFLHAVLDADHHVRLYFVENLLIQRLLDFGPIVGSAWIAALAAMLVYQWRGVTQERIAAAPYLIALLGLLAHNLVDFSMELAGGLVPFALLSGCVERLIAGPEADKSLAHAPRRAQSHRRALMASGIALFVAWSAVVGVAPNRLGRDVHAALDGKSSADLKQLIAARYRNEPHAWYLLGRQLLSESAPADAMAALSRSIELRPSNAHARLFRLAATLKSTSPKAAADDLAWLLQRPGDLRDRALDLCRTATATATEEALVEVLARHPEMSYELAIRLAADRPDLVERVALGLRKRFPNKRLGIEAVRAQLYTRRGLLPAAKAISLGLLTDPATYRLGLLVEGGIQSAEGKHDVAWAFLHELCDLEPGNWEACHAAMQSALQSQDPLDTLRWLQSRTPYVMVSQGVASIHYAGLANVYLKLGRLDEAVEAVRTAHSHAPGTKEVGILLCDVLLRAGLHAEAREQAEALLRLFPGDPPVLALLRRVEDQTSPLSLQRLRKGAAEALPGPPTPALNQDTQPR